jgi:hypothetical protein
VRSNHFPASIEGNVGIFLCNIINLLKISIN